VNLSISRREKAPSPLLRTPDSFIETAVETSFGDSLYSDRNAKTA
jgi:hypothetical protein